MKKILTICYSISLISFGFSQNIISNWNYNTITGTPTSPISDVGNGTSQVVGSMVVASAATGMDPIINNGCGAQNGLNPGAWSFTAVPGTVLAPNGVQFNSSTIGHQNILFTWDQRWSNTSTNTVKVQYTLDGLNWLDFVMTTSNTTFCNGSIDNGRFQNNGVGDQYRRISVNFSSIVGVNNNANFGVRIMAATHQLTGEFRQTSNTALLATGGTWRFDNVSIQGQADVSITSGNNFAQYSENIGLINVPITVSNANASSINLTLGLSVYSNASENVDYTWTNNITIPANTNGITNLSLSIIDDAIAEKAERIIVKILSGSNANISQTNNYQIIFIKDNDYVAPVPTNELNLNLLSSFSNGLTGANSAEIVTFDSSVDRLYIANSIAGKLDIVNFSNPALPVLISSINLAAYGNINSVVAHDSVVAVAIEAIPAQNNGKVVFLDYNGNLISQVQVGAMPDMLIFNNNFTKILTANEGEPDASYTNDPVGSVSIIDLTPGYSNLTNANVTNIGFTAYNGQEAALKAQGIRIFSTSASVAQDFEPEYIAISDDNSKAYVTLQENNALLTINLTTNTITSLSALGYSSYGSGSGNALDASDQSGSVLITGDLPIKGAYMPDAMFYKTINGQGLLFTANEGDSREFGSVIDANRISSSTFSNLDATVFPDQAILKNSKFLGRLSALKYSGDTDGDGDYDELHVMGGRSFSIWNPTNGSLVYDSKDLIEQITANSPSYGAIFNASNSTGAPAIKNRSDDKGPEPEGIAVSYINGSTYAFVALERIGGVMIFNVDIPTSPVFVGYANNRSTTLSGPDLGAEGIIIIAANESPNGKALVILANEVSSTLSIYQINTCADVSGAPIVSNDLSICPNQTTQLTVGNQSNVTYQWLLNNASIPSATTTNFTASQAGNYSVKIINNNLNCLDTISFVSVTNSLSPIISAGNDQAVCGGDTITLNATGADLYSWNNGVTSSSFSIISNSTSSSSNSSYTVTGTSLLTGCSAKDTVVVTINELPQINAGNDFQICSYEQVTLNASGGSSYSWNNNVQNNTPFNLQNTTSFTVTGSDINGCVNSDIVTVTVNVAALISAGNDTIICENNLPLLLNATSNQNNVTYSWNTGENTSSIFVDSTLTAVLTATNTFNCQSVDTVQITVLSSPIVELGSNDSICSNLFPIILSATSASVGLLYEWSNNQNSEEIALNSGGSYSVEVTDANGCKGTDEISILALNSPSVNAGTDKIVCEYNFPVTLLATGNGVSVEWSTGDASPFTSVNSPGTYTVTTTAQNGCQTSDDVIVTSDACLEINEINQSFKIFPNPTKSSISIIASFSLPTTYLLLTIDGKILKEGDVLSNSNETKINMSDLANGAYILQLVNQNLNQFNRIIKE